MRRRIFLGLLPLLILLVVVGGYGIALLTQTIVQGPMASQVPYSRAKEIKASATSSFLRHDKLIRDLPDVQIVVA